MPASLGAFVLEILRFFAPWVNGRAREVIGTVVTCLAVVAWAALQVLPFVVPPAVTVGDVVTVPVDVPVSTDIPVPPVDSGPFDAPAEVE